MKTTKDWISRPVHHHLLFWGLVFLCYCIANSEYHDSWREMMVILSFKIVIQAFVAYYFLGILVPQHATGIRPWRFAVQLLLLLVIVQILAEGWHYFVLEPTYPVTFIECIERYAGMTYVDRLFSGVAIFFKNPATYFPTAVVLVALQYFQKQREIAQLNEQKKTNELEALKHQMNPHFLFNTLNNLYALAVKKSNRVPEVIEKLSEILDYMLYRCQDRFVPIGKEIELLHNYLDLEKIRYGKRVQINFQHQVDQQFKIAPLLLLHFVENAFKHGVSQQVNQTDIQIDLRTTGEQTIHFSIENAVPTTSTPSSHRAAGIGLKNIKRQLNLLYPNQFQLQIKPTTDRFSVQLNIQTT